MARGAHRVPRVGPFEYKERVQEDRERDLELHGRLKGHDADAFEELYKLYSPIAYGVARRVVGNESIAQEVLHDAFMALWRAPEAFDASRGSLRTFLLSLTHHRAVDAVRREERLRQRNQRAVNLEPVYGEDVAEDVVEGAWTDQRKKEVREALETLPEDQRRVLEMAYFGGRTQVQIAGELQIPLGTVKTRTLAAMRKLRIALYQEAF